MGRQGDGETRRRGETTLIPKSPVPQVPKYMRTSPLSSPQVPKLAPTSYLLKPGTNIDRQALS